MNSHHAMLSPVLEILKSVDSLIPYGNHSMFQRLWKSEAETVLQEAEFDEASGAYEALDTVSDALEIFTRNAVNPPWIHQTAQQRREKVKALKELPQIPQRSQEWFDNYKKVLTASEFSALFQMNKRRKDLVYSKASTTQEVISAFRHACPTDEMNALSWGIRFESVVKQILEYKDKCKVFEPGRIQHPTNTHLAASPDGIIEESIHLEQIGRLVEIKCPYSRVIGKEIPSEYWIQMQIQMEVTDVDECEYIEVNLLSKKPNQVEPVDLSGATYTGILYLLKQTVAEDQPYDYKYVYGEIGTTEKPKFPKGYECVEEIPWGLKTWHRKIVQRDRAWYQGTLEWQTAFWRDVEAVKKGEQINQPASKVSACLITDD